MVWARIRVLVDGIEMSDSVIRYCQLHGAEMITVAVKLPPDVMRGGKIVNRDLLLAALRDMQAQVFGSKSKSKSFRRNVVLSLASLLPSVQLFSLPLVDSREVEKAIDLNVRMVSPSDTSLTASGWQILQRDEEHFRMDVMSMFVNRAVVTDLADVSRESGLIIVAVETKGLSIARAFVQLGGAIWRVGAVIMVYVDDAGFDLIVIRNGILHFEYATSWMEMMDEKGQVPEDAFKKTLVKNVNQVLNFYRQHWNEAADRFAVAAGGLSETVRGLLAEHFREATVTLVEAIIPPGISDFIMPSYGASMRGFDAHAENEVNFLGDGAESVLHGEMAYVFFRFWRIVLVTAFGFLIIVAAGGDFLFSRSESSYMNSVSASPDIAAALAQSEALQGLAQTFNQSVENVQSVESASMPKNIVMSKLEIIAVANNITLSDVNVSSPASVGLTGKASSQDAVLAFKKALESNGFIKSVSLPLTGIQPSNNGFSFTMTLVL